MKINKQATKAVPIRRKVLHKLISNEMSLQIYLFMQECLYSTEQNQYIHKFSSTFQHFAILI